MQYITNQRSLYGRSSPSPQHFTRGRSEVSTQAGLPARLAFFVAVLVYAWALHHAHQYYLSPNWTYYGFPFVSPGITEVLSMIGLLLVTAAVMPVEMRTPSSLVLSFMFNAFYVPCIVITLCLRADSISYYGPVLLALTLSFCFASFVAVKLYKPVQFGNTLPSNDTTIILTLSWLMMLAVIVIVYRDILAFTSLADVYGQRFRGRAVNPVMAYISSYHIAFFSPLLLILGLYRRSVIAIGFGIAGFMVNYMVDAQRTVALLPILMIISFFVFGAKSYLVRLSCWFPAVLAVFTYFATTNYGTSDTADNLAIYLVFRTLSLPGLTFSQYYTLFSEIGFTYWSHLKGFELFIEAPPALAGDPNWPKLGNIVGSFVYNDAVHNVNANMFSSDGAAAAGVLGVIVVGVVFAVWLRLLDLSATGWDRRFACLTVLPIAVALTNVQLSTALLSFGGALVPLMLYLLGPKRNLGSRFVVSAPPRQRPMLRRG